MKNEPVKIFWTGGLDSTYRVLQLALAENKEVQPYYLVDFTRRSFPIELDTIKSLSKEINKRKRNVLPLIVFISDEIPNDENVYKSFEATKKHTRFGSQYRYLANFCSFMNINQIEVGMQIHSVNYNDNDFFITDKDKKLILNENSSSYPVMKFFKYPIINLSKHDMLKQADNYGFLDLLEMTWFCHKPVGKKPCGICPACKDAIHQNRELKFARLKFLRKVKRYLAAKIKALSK